MIYFQSKVLVFCLLWRYFLWNIRMDFLKFIKVQNCCLNITIDRTTLNIFLKTECILKELHTNWILEYIKRPKTAQVNQIMIYNESEIQKQRYRENKYCNYLPCCVTNLLKLSLLTPSMQTELKSCADLPNNDA